MLAGPDGRQGLALVGVKALDAQAPEGVHQVIRQPDLSRGILHRLGFLIMIIGDDVLIIGGLP